MKTIKGALGMDPSMNRRERTDAKHAQNQAYNQAVNAGTAQPRPQAMPRPTAGAMPQPQQMQPQQQFNPMPQQGGGYGQNQMFNPNQGYQNLPQQIQGGGMGIGNFMQNQQQQMGQQLGQQLGQQQNQGYFKRQPQVNDMTQQQRNPNYLQGR